MPPYYVKAGCPDLTPEELEETKVKYRKEADQLYTFYASTATLIDPEDL